MAKGSYKAGECEKGAHKIGFPSYDHYLKSDHWREFKAHCRREIRPFRCTICQGFRKGRMVIHHITYARIGHERLEDVKLLCSDCHDMLHQMHRDHDLPLRKFGKAVHFVRMILARKKEATREERVKMRRAKREKKEIDSRRLRQLKRTRQTPALIPSSPESCDPMIYRRLTSILHLIQKGRSAVEIAHQRNWNLTEVEIAIGWIELNRFEEGRIAIRVEPAPTPSDAGSQHTDRVKRPLTPLHRGISRSPERTDRPCVVRRQRGSR
jgi:cyanate lyase